MKDVRLEDVIRNYVPLPPHPNGRGFYPVVCKVCADHGRKGPRAGFKFDDDSVGYNCFNCGHKAIYNPDTSTNMSDDMIKVLDAFNVPDDEWKQVLLTSMARKNQGNTNLSEKQVNTNIEPSEIELPDHFYPLGPKDDPDKWTIIARDYLEFERGVDPDSHPFYLSTGQGDKQAMKWKGRLIIPIYKNEKLIYYQGRALVKMQNKYLSPSSSKDKVLCGFDKLFEDTEMPLYVVEGWFDAYAIDGVAVFGNQLSDEQVKWLNRSRRPKVVIPDIFGDGHLLANQAIDLGWSVAFPDTGDCKDMSAAVKRFGKLYVMKSIVDNTMSGLMAQTAIGVHCKGGQDKGKKKNKKARQGKR